MSLAETKPVIPITKSLPLSMVSNLYRYVPTGAGGFSSPTQLYSPAPVRSGKTPMSPVAPLDTQYAFAAELTDDDEDDANAHDVVVDDFSSYACISNNLTHPFYRVSCTQPRTKLSKDSVTGPANSQSVADHSSLISPLNLNVPAKPTPCLTNSTTLDRLDASSRWQPTTGNTFETISRVVKSHSVLDFDPRHDDEEFTFRMQAEPFSLARDSVPTGDLCVGVVCDDCTLHEDPGTQSVVDRTQLCEPNEPVGKQLTPAGEESAVNLSGTQCAESLDLKPAQSCEE